MSCLRRGDTRRREVLECVATPKSDGGAEECGRTGGVARLEGRDALASLGRELPEVDCL
jgi:hypothetical protein